MKIGRKRVLLISGILLTTIVFAAIMFSPVYRMVTFWKAFGDARNQANHAFEAIQQKRPGTPGTFENLTWGVKFGWTSDQVDAIMCDAKKEGPLYPRESKTFIKIYTWNFPKPVGEAVFISDIYTVYFDEDGKAVKIERLFYKENQGTLIYTFDLQRQTISASRL